MANFLLVHGSCHGAWCWRDVVPALEGLGHTARAIDLPAHGDDRSPAAEATLESYADAILAATDDGPVTLVGHSAAGFPITLAAEHAPDRFRRLVYLCAYVPAPGMSMIDMRRAGPRQPLKGHARANPDGLTYSISADGARATFYHDCPAATVAWALPRLCPEPILPQATPLPPLSRWQGVEKHYILCEDDHTIPPEYQATMAADFPRHHQSRLPCGHSPFFAMPERLAHLLGAIAGDRPLPFAGQSG